MSFRSRRRCYGDPMLTLRKAGDRFHTAIDWLDSWHTFSFSEHYDPRHVEFRALRVINDDRVAPSRGFGMHPHRDMEIITYVLDGVLQHKDSMGNGSLIKPGEVQRMSAGTGVFHSEQNPDPAHEVHLLQIWIHPNERGLKPSYEQKAFSEAERKNVLRLVASEDAREGAVRVHQDVALYATLLDSEKKVTHELRPGRHAWIHVAKGEVEVNGVRMQAGDGASVSDERKLEIAGKSPSEVLLFDLA
jgi:quercetin 2,3-dioxygenase